MSYMIYDAAPRAQVFGWLALVMGVNTVRVVLAAYCQRTPWPVEHARLWYRRISIGVLVSAFTWGLGAWLFFPVDNLVARTFVALIMSGVVSGGVSVLSPLREVAVGWVILIMIPIIWQSFLLDDPRWTVFGVCFVLFILHHTGAVLNAHKRIVDSIALAFKNEELVVGLEVARDEALNAAKAKSAFLANMSHEIRTPMTSILGYADLLRERPAPNDVESYSQAIQRSGKHLLVIINDILDFSKIDADKMTVERIACDPVQVIQFALEMMDERAREKGLPLRKELREPFPRTIQSDPVRLQQILVNLISNAIKFTQAGEVRVEAFAEAKGDAGRLCVRVHDTGIGMSPDQLENLFRPFTQADATITRRYGGTGLGLSISHRLAGLLGGTLTATSEVGRGSCFELALQLGAWDEIDFSTARSERRAPAPTPAQPFTGKFYGRVLLAEDGLDNQRLIRLLLERRGAQVDVVENGHQAVERASAAAAADTPYDLVLMDLQMPEMDGMTATRVLKQRGNPSPIVALTAQAMEGDRDSCLAAGFDDYETKPIHGRRLDALLARFLVRDPTAD
jgi:signal transduction histidine kinase/CheY-like chemotaxis protein